MTHLAVVGARPPTASVHSFRYSPQRAAWRWRVAGWRVAASALRRAVSPHKRQKGKHPPSPLICRAVHRAQLLNTHRDAAMSAPSAPDALSVLFAAYRKTRHFFPALHNHTEHRGDSEDVGPVLKAHGAFFAESRTGPVFTSTHSVRATGAQKDVSREAAAAMAARTGACGNVACASRARGATRPQLKLCGRCHLVGYCCIDCQRAHWPEHKDYCAANALASPSSVAVAVDEAVGAFLQMATAAATNASGPIAMLVQIWRQQSGYKGGPPSSAARGDFPMPPVVLLEIDDAARAPPAAMRISALPIFEIMFAAGGGHPEKRFVDEISLGPLLLMLLDSDAPPGPELRSGARVMVVATTPARDPRRTKIMTLTHGVPLADLAKTFRAIERAAADESSGDSDDSEDSTALNFEEPDGHHSARRDADHCAAARRRGGGRGPDGRRGRGVDGRPPPRCGDVWEFCRRARRLAPREHGLRHVVAIIVGDVEMTYGGEPI